MSDQVTGNEGQPQTEADAKLEAIVKFVAGHDGPRPFCPENLAVRVPLCAT
jgi:hypothetical protein